MAAVKTWSTTAASNNSAPPDGAPENMARSAVNNVIRENMSALATWYQDAEWRDLNWTVANASATSFTVTGVDVTAALTPGRRLRLTDSSTLYAVVVSSTFSTNTTCNVVTDSGSISGSLSAVAIDMLSAESAPRGWSVIDRQEASSDATLGFTLPSGFTSFALLLEGVIPATDNVSLQLLTDSGATTGDTGASDYDHMRDEIDLTSGSPASALSGTSGGASIVMMAAQSNGATTGVDGEVRIYDPADTARHTKAKWELEGQDNGGDLRISRGSGKRAAAHAVDYVIVKFSSGNIASGTVSLMGFR